MVLFCSGPTVVIKANNCTARRWFASQAWLFLPNSNTHADAVVEILSCCFSMTRKKKHIEPKHSEDDIDIVKEIISGIDKPGSWICHNLVRSTNPPQFS